MTTNDIISLLETRFGSAITGKKLDGIDPFVTVDPSKLVEICQFLRDDPQLRFDLLNCISGVDYLEIDAKKAPKAGFEPHLEIVYHLSSFTHRHRFVLKLMLPRWKDNQVGQLPEVPSVVDVWKTAGLARARSLRYERSDLYGAPRSPTYPARGRLGRVSVAEGL